MILLIFIAVIFENFNLFFYSSEFIIPIGYLAFPWGTGSRAWDDPKKTLI